MQTHPGELAGGGSRAGCQGYDYDNGSESESAAGASGTLPDAAPNAIPPFAGPERGTWMCVWPLTSVRKRPKNSKTPGERKEHGG